MRLRRKCLRVQNMDAKGRSLMVTLATLEPTHLAGRMIQRAERSRKRLRQKKTTKVTVVNPMATMASQKPLDR